MGRPLCALFVCLVTLPIFCQTPSSYPQVATIMSVDIHHADAENTGKPTQYDISLKVGNTVYVVLFTPPTGVSVVQYSVGMNVSVD